MDLSHACAPTWRGNRTNTFGHATQVQKPLTCFQCSKEGHFACNCPQRHFGANMAYASDYDKDLGEMLPEELESTIARIKVELEAMSIEDKARLVQEMGANTDFLEA